MEITLTNCDREPVSTPGAIQSFGAIFVVNPTNFEIVQVSENLESVTGISPEAALQKEISAVLGPKAKEALLTEAQNFENDRFTAKIWQSGGMFLLEAEAISVAGILRPEQKGLDLMQKAENLQELLSHAVKTVGEITGLDRVMAYRFHPDLHGEVVAEYVRTEVDSYLGLHYPATDIPVPARAVFLKNWVRMIPDVNDLAVPLKPVLNPVTHAPLDLGTSLLRAVSPIHLEYLKNMGVAATLTISLVVNGKLWGLLACHSKDKKYISPILRNACESIGRMASAHIALKDELDYLHAGQRYREMNRAMKAHIEEGFDLSLDLVDSVPNLLQFIQSSAVASALYLPGDWVCMGDVPTDSELNELVDFLVEKHLGEPIFASDSLVDVFPRAKEFKGRPFGLLALHIPKTSRNYILWFRSEQIRTVKWAGNPVKAPDAEGRLNPRVSFQEWKEIVAGKSIPWKNVEVDAAEELRNSIMGVDLKRSYAKEQLARKDAERSMIAREELMSILSHDLKNPIGSIKLGAKVAEKFLASGALPRVQECLERIDRATSNMDSLINDILSITKIEAGHMEMDSKVESLSDVAEEVIDMLSPLSSQADLRVTLHQNAERTEIKCDRSRIIQVLSNVLGNAIKFTLPGGKIDIALTNPSRDTITISIKDTGPGIPPANLRNIFDRFWQAQQTRRLGTGLGLAIAKGVVEHHGGAIWAESDGKSGTIFHVNFPLVAIIV